MGIFNKIFAKKEPLVPFSLSYLKNDIHSHLIPGIDDGAKTMDDSILLARGLVDLGYQKIVTTPHIMSDFYKNNPEIITAGLKNLNATLQHENINLKVEAAAEYYVDFDFIERIGKEELLTFGDNYVLIEFSFMQAPQGLKESLFALQTNGYKPVLAHPERYIYWHQDMHFYEELKNRDVFLQLNILSLIGIYSPGVTQIAEKLIKHQMIDWLGTDLHNDYQLNRLKGLKLKESLIKQIGNLTLLNQSL